MKEKRKWVYLQTPPTYEILCDCCSGVNIEWSEFKGMVWCYDCKIDTPGTPGIFGGPIPFETATLLGLCFDRLDLETNQVLTCSFDEFGELQWLSEG